MGRCCKCWPKAAKTGLSWPSVLLACHSNFQSPGQKFVCLFVCLFAGRLVGWQSRSDDAAFCFWHIRCTQHNSEQKAGGCHTIPMPNHSFRASVRPTNWYIVVSRGSGTVEQQVKSPVKDVTLLQSRGNFESGTKGAFMNGTYIISAT